MTAAFTPEQEARVREIAREQSDADCRAAYIWDGVVPEKAETFTRNRREKLDAIAAGTWAPPGGDDAR